MKLSTHRHYWIALVYFLGLAVLLTYPAVHQLGTHFIGRGSDFTWAYAPWWFARTITSGRNPFYLHMLAYPDGISGAWLWGNIVYVAPAGVLAAVMPLPLAFNLSVWVHLTLNGLAVYWLGRRLALGMGAALLMGTTFALYPALQAQLSVPLAGLPIGWGVALYIWALVRPANARAGTVVVSAMFLLATLTNYVLLVHALLPVTMVLLSVFAFRLAWQKVWRGVWGSGLGLLAALVALTPLLRERAPSPPATSSGLVQHSADLLAFLTPSPQHPILTDLVGLHARWHTPPVITDIAYVGGVTLCLAVIGAWAFRREARPWLSLALVAWGLSLGPLLKIGGEVMLISFDEVITPVLLPGALFSYLPALNPFHVPGGFNLVMGLALAGLAGYGWQALSLKMTRLPLRWGVWALLICLITSESMVFWSGGLPSFPMQPNPGGQIADVLREDPSVRAVLNLPAGHPPTTAAGLLLQTVHHRPLITANLLGAPPEVTDKLVVLQNSLQPALLRSVGADAVILHRAGDDPAATLEAAVRQALGVPLADDGQTVVWRVPPVGTLPPFTALLTPDGRFTVATSYVASPEPVWATITATLDAVRQPVFLTLDGKPVHEWFIDGPVTVQLQLPFTEPFQAVALEVPEACPRLPTTALTCHYVKVTDVTLTANAEAPLLPAIAWEDGVTLDESTVNGAATGITVGLLWHFANGLDEQQVRLVAILDQEGNLVASDDHAPGYFSPGESWLESVTLDVPPGTYTVYSAWYRHPGLTRLPVLSDVPEADNRWISLVTVTVPAGAAP